MGSLERRNYEARKLTPPSRNNGGVVHRPPEFPPIVFKDLFKLAHVTPRGVDLGSLGGRASWREEVINVRDRPTPVFVVTPQTKVPLTQLFQTSHGGHRVGGGGTSPEALRRARKNAARLKNHSR